MNGTLRCFHPVTGVANSGRWLIQSMTLGAIPDSSPILVPSQAIITLLVANILWFFASASLSFRRFSQERILPTPGVAASPPRGNPSEFTYLCIDFTLLAIREDDDHGP
jgi:hypothetical protein